MPSGYRISMRDYSGETSSFAVLGADMSAATYNDILNDIADLEDAIEGVTLGTIARGVIEAVVTEGSQANPTNVWAQRENKWMIEYADTVTGDVFRRELPTADLSLLRPGSELMDLSTGAGLAFKEAFEAYVTSEDGNPVEIQRVYYVARDL